jgi:hypothetical protein
MITVDLKRQDDGIVIGTAQIDESLCYPDVVTQFGYDIFVFGGQSNALGLTIQEVTSIFESAINLEI